MRTKGIMKTFNLIAATITVLFAASFPGICQIPPPQSVPSPRPIPPPRLVPQRAEIEGDSRETGAKDTVNYVIRVEWKDSKGATHHLEVMTTEGTVSLDTFLQDKAKIDDSEIPITISLKGTLTVLGPEKGRLNLFLGRTVPYVTSTSSGSGARTSSYQQRQVGLASTFVVTFGKPLVIQSDENEKVTLLVKRAAD